MSEDRDAALKAAHPLFVVAPADLPPEGFEFSQRPGSVTFVPKGGTVGPVFTATEVAERWRKLRESLSNPLDDLVSPAAARKLVTAYRYTNPEAAKREDGARAAVGQKRHDDVMYEALVAPPLSDLPPHTVIESGDQIRERLSGGSVAAARPLRPVVLNGWLAEVVGPETVKLTRVKPIVPPTHPDAKLTLPPDSSDPRLGAAKWQDLP